MKNAPDAQDKRNGSAAMPRARLRDPRRAWLAALRQAEVIHWQISGGDFLNSRYQAGKFDGSSYRQVGKPTLLALILGLATTLLAGCSGSHAQSPTASPPPPEVPVRRVAERPIPLQFEFTGRSVPSHHVDVRARVGGSVVEVPYREGEVVEAGALLFEIDPRPYLAVHARAEAEVTRAQASVRFARQELERAERLAASDAIAVEELERRRTEVETAGALLASAIAQEAAAALDVEFTKVKAPVAGRVSRALVRPGNLVSGGDGNGTLLTTLVAITPLHIHFTLDEPAFQHVADLRAAGRRVRAELQLGSDDRVVEGELNYLSPALDARSGTAQARLVVANPDGRLVPGLFARVTLIAESEKPRMLVPETAVGAQQGTRYVLVVDKDNRVTHRTVVLGERRGDDRVVTSGLQSGESIVINGLQRVRPGMTVQPVAASMAAH